MTLNTTDLRGGAAIAAWRLLQGLERFYGIENYFLVGQKYSSHPKVVWTRKNKYEHYFEYGLNLATNLIGLQYQFFPFSSRTILHFASTIRPDLIYLRNIHGGYFALPLLKKLSKIAPIVWTLSDMWSFTGNCAHTFGDNSWKYLRGCKNYKIYPSIGINTGRWLLRRKMCIYHNSNIHIICPSQWLYSLACQSPVFHGKEIVQIYNGFDLDVFKPKDRAACRKALGLPEKAKVIMFCADFLLNNPWKGGNELFTALSIINHKINERLHLLLIGQGDPIKLHQFKHLKIHYLGPLHNDDLLAACYSAADLFIYPTKADNLPNVLIEALACGTPCITFDVGGCGEIVQDGDTGWVIPYADSRAFAEKTIQTLNDRRLLKIMSNKARSEAEQKFSLKRMCKAYFEYFIHIINQSTDKDSVESLRA